MKKIKDFTFHNCHHHDPISMSSLALSRHDCKWLPARLAFLASRSPPVSLYPVFLLLAFGGPAENWLFGGALKLWRRRTTLMRSRGEDSLRPWLKSNVGKWDDAFCSDCHSMHWGWLSMQTSGRVVSVSCRRSLLCVSVSAHVCACTQMCMSIVVNHSESDGPLASL